MFFNDQLVLDVQEKSQQMIENTGGQKQLSFQIKGL